MISIAHVESSGESYQKSPETLLFDHIKSLSKEITPEESLTGNESKEEKSDSIIQWPFTWKINDRVLKITRPLLGFFTVLYLGLIIVTTIKFSVQILFS
jgi:hypothetical protein